MKSILTNKFRIVYFISLVVLTALIFCYLVIIWQRLNTFEKSKPENVASSVFNQYFREFAFNKLFALEKSSVSEFETLNNYTAFLNERAGSGERNFINIPEETEGIKKYVVYSDGVGFAEFELKERKSAFGLIWELSNVSTIFDNTDSFEVVVPAGSNVQINGKKAGDNNKTGAGLTNAMSGTYDIYTISRLIAKPIVEVHSGSRSRDVIFESSLNEFSAIPVLTADIIDTFTLSINGINIDDSFLIKDSIKTDETNRLKLNRKIYRILYGSNETPNVSIVSIAGKEGVIKDTGNYSFVQEFVSDADFQRQYTELAIATAKTYAEFMTDNSNIRELQKYFQTGTRIYQMIRTSEVYFYTPHIDYWFDSVNASEFFPREDDTFSCRVTLVHFVRRTASEVFRFPLDITLFYKKNNDQYFVIDLISNS
ncbi:MAG: hypothetical protein FWB86_01105 [Treponema sp.]|nr:hypothetical protein [Treponema sp.]MCL2250696.1 hypothetical protein [Treponema sp.]